MEQYNKLLAAYQLTGISQPPSLNRVALQYNVTYSTLWARINKGTKSRKAANELKQRLTPGEEEAIRRHILQLEAWHWPPRTQQLYNMGNELLRAKGVDTKVDGLGKNWLYRFYERHPDLAARYASPIDYDRTVAANEDQIRRYFDLYKETREKYQIHDDDVYNMDEKGCAMGVIGKSKVVASF